VKRWSGTPAELYDVLTTIVVEEVAAPAG